MNLHQLFLTKNECYKDGKTITPKGIMVHSTGADNPNLRRYVGPDDGLLGANQNGNCWNVPGLYVCVHAFVGLLDDGTVATYQTLPWHWRGWHAGGPANNTHISFEICEDDLTDAEYLKKVYREAVELTAHLCKLYHLDPLADGVVICHSEGFTRGISSNHSDVMHWWPRHGLSMDTFRAAVAAEMEDDEMFSYEQWKEYQTKYEAEKANAEPADWSQEARTWAEENGIIAGDGSGKMQYKGACTREQMVVFLYRFFGVVKKLFGK